MKASYVFMAIALSLCQSDSLKMRQASNLLDKQTVQLLKTFVQAESDIVDILSLKGEGSRRLATTITLLQLAATTPSHFSPQEASLLQEVRSNTKKYVDPLLLRSFQAENPFATLKYLLDAFDYSAPSPPRPVMKPFSEGAVGCKVSFAGNASKQTSWGAKGESSRYGALYTNGTGDGIVVPGKVFHPENETEIMDIMRNPECDNIVVTATGHSVGYNLGPPNEKPVCTLSLSNFKNIEMDWCANTVKIGAGVTVKDVASTLVQFNRTLQTWIQHKDVTIIGMMTTQAQGVGSQQHRVSFVNSLVEMTVINGNGERKVVSAQSEEARAWAVSIGDLGVILDATFKIFPDSLMFETCWTENNNDADKDFGASGLGDENPGEQDLSSDFLVDPIGPAMKICRLDRRTTDLEDTQGITILNADYDASKFRVLQFKEQHIEIFKLLDKSLFFILGLHPKIQQKVWQWVRGARNPEPSKETPRLRKASFELMNDFYKLDLPQNQPIWGSIYVKPHQALSAYKELLRIRQCQPQVSIELGIVMRAFNDDLPTYLGHKGFTVEIWFLSWAPRVAVEAWMEKYMCAVKCKLGIDGFEYHLGEIVPKSLIRLMDEPTKDQVEKFKAIEAREDPHQKFGNTQSHEIGLMLEPQQHMCDYCATIGMC